MVRFGVLGWLAVLSVIVRAQVPQLINFQGRVTVNGAAFTGQGQFKFALLNAAGTVTHWSNNGSSSGGSEPNAAVGLMVSQGLYSVRLGDATLGNMTAVPSTVFANPGVLLRVWFNDGAHGSQRLTPDQPIAAVGYSMMAASATSVPDGAISSGKLAPGSVGSLQLANDPASLSKVTAGAMATDGNRVTLGAVNPLEKLEVAGRVVVGDSANALPKAGTIRWSGTDFEGYDGTKWLSLTGKGGSASVPVQPIPNMVWIDPGTFTMGSPPNEQESYQTERPQTVVTLTTGFWIGSREVTQAEYQAVVGRNPSLHFGDTTRPVESMTWYDAVGFCGTLTIREHLAGRIPGNWAYRLPTEAEWEYAARAGTTTRFSFGDDPSYTSLPNYGWYSGNGGGSPHSVGGKSPNAWGLYDIHGNVWEWCQDYYGSYPGGQVFDPLGPASGSDRLVRGGSFNYGGRECRSASRNSNYPPGGRYDDVGIRLVLAEGQP